jgi:predicted NAD/FAD-binding protein
LSCFSAGIIHSDPTVIPADCRDAILTQYANYIERFAPGEYENTFVLSSWVPVAQTLAQKIPMLVTYNPRPDKTIQSVVGRVSNVRAHPHLSVANLAIVFLLRLIQGRRGVYYCGSYATPGNGHDLSLLSGFAVAHTLGAEYPFVGNERALNDFRRLCSVMGLPCQPK